MKITYIIPVYNVAPWLRDCLDSLLMQTKDSWTCICVDDGSTDGSNQILKEYQEKDSRVYVFRQDNQGVAKARNKGLDLAKSLDNEWIAFLDGDDVVAPDYIEVCENVVNSYKTVDIVSFNELTFDDKSLCLFSNENADKNICILDVREYYVSCKATEWNFCGKIYRKRVLENVYFPSYKNGEDIVFVFQAVLNANYMACIDSCLYGYRKRSHSASHNPPTLRRIQDYFNVIMDTTRLLRYSNKRVDKKILRNKGRAITEGLMLKVSGTHLLKDTVLVEEWHRCLKEMLKFKEIKGIRRFFVRLYLMYPRLWIAKLFFYSLVWLKRNRFWR